MPSGVDTTLARPPPFRENFRRKAMGITTRPRVEKRTLKMDCFASVFMADFSHVFGESSSIVVRFSMSVVKSFGVRRRAAALQNDRQSRERLGEASLPFLFPPFFYLGAVMFFGKLSPSL
jgi:hypothetical protein